MAERTQKINFALSTIPQYDGSLNSLNIYISSVDLVSEILSALEPALDDFEQAMIFLSVRNKIVGKALDTIKDIEVRNWQSLKDSLLNNFADKATSVTILHETINIFNIKNPISFFEIIKSKFNNFKAKLRTEEVNEVKRNAVINFSEKLVIAHYISNINDPFRNNLATRNPKTINEVELLIKNDLQYLKINQMQKLNESANCANKVTNKVTNGNTNYQTKFVPKNEFNQNKPLNFVSNRKFNYNTPNRRYSTEPEPMSVQTRQTQMVNYNSRLVNPNNISMETYCKENVEVTKDKEPKHFLDDGLNTKRDEMMNISQMSKLPYLKIKDYIILLDTGSAINLINKSYVDKNRKKFKIYNEKFEFYTATGKTVGNEFVHIKINNNPIKCHIFNFHKDFNVLLGVHTIKQLKIDWDLDKDFITLDGKIIKLKYFGESNNFETNEIEACLNQKQAESLPLDVEKKNKTITDIELKKKNNKIKSLKQSVNNLKGYVMTCNNCNKLVDENSELQSYVNQLQLDLERWQKEVVTIDEEIREKNLEIERNVNTIDNLNTELYKNKVLIKKLNCDLSSVNKKYDLLLTKIYEKEQAYSVALIEVTNYKNDIESLKEKTFDLNNVINDLNENVVQYKRENELYRTEVASLKLSNDVLNVKLVTLMKDNAEGREMRNNLEQSNQQLIKETSKINEEKLYLLKDNLLLKDEVENYKMKFANVESMQIKLNQINEDLSEEKLYLLKDNLLLKDEVENYKIIIENDKMKFANVENMQMKLKQINEDLSEEKLYLLKDNLLLKDEIEKYKIILEDDKKKFINVENMQIKLKESEFKLAKLDSNYKILAEQLRLSKDKEDVLQNKLKVNSEIIENYLSDIARLNNLNRELYDTTNKSKVSGFKFIGINTVNAFTEIDDDDVIQNVLKEKFINSKRENVESLLKINGMNQALKEWGETISKQQAYCNNICKKFQESVVQAKQNLYIVNMKEDLIRQLKKEIIYLKLRSNFTSHETSLQSHFQMKSNEIKSLKAELLSLKERMTDAMEHSNYAESEDIFTSIIIKSEEILRIKDLESSLEERYEKFHNLTIKLKIKVKESIADILKERHEKVEIQQNLLKTTQTFHNQINKFEDDLEVCKSKNILNVKNIDELVIDMNEIKQNSKNWKKHKWKLKNTLQRQITESKIYAILNLEMYIKIMKRVSPIYQRN